MPKRNRSPKTSLPPFIVDDSFMLFRRCRGRHVRGIWPFAGDGSRLRADGRRVLTLAQAATRDPLSKTILRDIWLATWGDVARLAELTPENDPLPTKQPRRCTPRR